jgi:hypothetical protein
VVDEVPRHLYQHHQYSCFRVRAVGLTAARFSISAGAPSIQPMKSCSFFALSASWIASYTMEIIPPAALTLSILMVLKADPLESKMITTNITMKRTTRDMPGRYQFWWRIRKASTQPCAANFCGDTAPSRRNLKTGFNHQNDDMSAKILRSKIFCLPWSISPK